MKERILYYYSKVLFSNSLHFTKSKILPSSAKSKEKASSGSLYLVIEKYINAFLSIILHSNIYKCIITNDYFNLILDLRMIRVHEKSNDKSIHVLTVSTE